MHLLISVIVPVYNVEKYLDRCIDSIVKQTYKNLEIILVDDGATDTCPEMCDLWKNKDDRIRVIHKENGGLSSARNEGLKHAKGEYVIFIDSDDWIENDFLEKLYEEAKLYNLDIVCGGYKTFFSDNHLEEKRRKEELINLGVVKGRDFLLAQLESNDYRMEVWDDLYRRDFLLENNLFFIEGVLHEDEEYTPRALLAAKRVKLVNVCGYMYRKRENSIMTSKVSLNHVNSFEYILSVFINGFERASIKSEKKIYSRLCSNMFYLYTRKLSEADVDINKYKYFKSLPRKKIIDIMNYQRSFNWKEIVRRWLIIYAPYIYYGWVTIN